MQDVSNCTHMFKLHFWPSTNCSTPIQGVRATLIDKGSSPAWSPVTLQEVGALYQSIFVCSPRKKRSTACSRGGFEWSFLHWASGWSDL